MTANIMTDQEMLILAAKAVGIELRPMQINNVSEQGDNRFIGFMTEPSVWSRGWFNPLDDDGDAFDLLARLALNIRYVTLPHSYNVTVYNDQCPAVMEIIAFDPTSSYNFGVPDKNAVKQKIRRAITKAAAEIHMLYGDKDD